VRVQCRCVYERGLSVFACACVLRSLFVTLYLLAAIIRLIFLEDGKSPQVFLDSLIRTFTYMTHINIPTKMLHTYTPIQGRQSNGFFATDVSGSYISASELDNPIQARKVLFVFRCMIYSSQHPTMRM